MAATISRIPERRVLLHAWPWRALQPRIQLHFCRLEQMRRGDGLGALWTPRCRTTAARDEGRRADGSRMGRGIQQAVAGGSRAELGGKSLPAALEGHGLAGSGRCREGAASTHNLVS